MNGQTLDQLLVAKSLSRVIDMFEYFLWNTVKDILKAFTVNNQNNPNSDFSFVSIWNFNSAHVPTAELRFLFPKHWPVWDMLE